MSQNPKDNLLGKTFFSKYTLTKKIGEGSFGSIYIGTTYDNEEYALKFEHRNKGQNLLESEANLMSYLRGRKILILTYIYNSWYTKR